MISYAQNFEDVMLRRVFRDRKNGFYIDVGAADPVVDSVTKFFYEEGWSGINIEPNEYFYNKLLADRPRDINLHLAVGASEESRMFHVFEQFGNSTFEEEYRDSFAAQGFESKEEATRVTTLAAICRDYVHREIDFLKIDCEGWEKLVIEGADWDRYRPTVLVIEATEPGTTNPAWFDWEAAIVQNERYEMAYFDGVNRFYLRREYRDLRSHFATPPNVFDAFTSYRAAVAEDAQAILHEHERQQSACIESLEQQLRAALAQQAEQAGVISALQASLTSLKGELAAAQQNAGALQRECDALRSNFRQFEATSYSQLAQSDKQLQELTSARAQLESDKLALTESLFKARLWVGQLSQELAAPRARQ